MNVNKKINQIEKKVSQKIDDMVMLNMEELNQKIYDHFTPYSNQMQEILMEVYGHPYMTIEQFANYTEKMNELLEPFKQDNRDDILLQFSEEIVKKNKTILSESMEEMLNEFSKLGISYHRVTLEHKKVFNSAVSRMQRYLNQNYHEVCNDLKEICRFSIDSMLDYNKSRVIDDEEEIKIEEIMVEVESTNNQLIKMTDFGQVTDWLESQGYNLVRIVGSHHIYKNGSHSVPVPLHKGKDFNKFLGYQIQREILKVIE